MHSPPILDWTDIDSSGATNSQQTPHLFSTRDSFIRTDAVVKARQETGQGNHHDSRSVIASSTFTNTSKYTLIPVRIVRRSDTSTIEENCENVKIPPPTWSTYSILRRRVNGLFHRKEIYLQKADSPSTSVEALNIDSSKSFFHVRRRATLSRMSSVSSQSRLLPRTLSSRNTNKQPQNAHIRRHRSFSGIDFPLSVIDATEELDEATAEAAVVVEAIRRRWVFEEVAIESLH